MRMGDVGRALKRRWYLVVPLLARHRLRYWLG